MLRTHLALNLGPIQGEGLGPFGNVSMSGEEAAANVINLVSKVVGVMTVAAFIWFLLEFIFAGYEWMAAAGDAKKIGEARERITHAFMGIIIIVAAWTILAVVGQFLGVDTLVSPKTLIENLGIGGSSPSVGGGGGMRR